MPTIKEKAGGQLVCEQLDKWEGNQGEAKLQHYKKSKFQDGQTDQLCQMLEIFLKENRDQMRPEICQYKLKRLESS